MATRIVSTRGISRGPRRKTLWLDFAQVLQDVVAIPGGNVVLLSSLNTAALALRPFTVVRTRGVAWWSFDQTAANEFVAGALAFGTAQDAAVAAGIGSLPTPVFEAGSSNWFSWTPLMASIFGSTAVGFADGSKVFHFDSKAQRKIESGTDIYVAAENESATDGGLLMFMARILIKLN